MKQRLLLALLMLFSSVGFMKVDAQISITLPKTEKAETVTITFNARHLNQEIYQLVHIPHLAMPLLQLSQLLRLK